MLKTDSHCSNTPRDTAGTFTTFVLLQVETSMEVSLLPPPKSTKKIQQGRAGTVSSRPRPVQYSRGVVGTSIGSNPTGIAVVLVTYNFKAGLRRSGLII